MNNPEESGIVCLEDLPDSEWIYFEKGYIRKILEKIYSLYSNKKENRFKFFSRILKISYHWAGHLYRRDRYNLRISELFYIFSFLPKEDRTFFLNELQDKIVRIGYQRSIHKPKLPINFLTKEGFGFLADLFTDGSLNSNFQVTYSNTNLELLLDDINNLHSLLTSANFKLSGDVLNNVNYLNPKEIASLLNKSLEDSPLRINVSANKKIAKDKAVYYTHQIIYPNFLGKMLHFNLKVPKGRRVYTNPSLPKFILNDKRFTNFFIKKVLSNEGNYGANGCYIGHSIDVSNYAKKFSADYTKLKFFLNDNKSDLAPKLLWGYKKLAMLLGCKNISNPYVANFYKTKKGATHVKWSIYIPTMDVKTLFETNSLDNNFQNKFLNYIKNKNYYRMPLNVRILDLVKHGEALEKTHGYFTSQMLSSFTGLELSTIQKRLKQANKIGLVSYKIFNNKIFHFNINGEKI